MTPEARTKQKIKAVLDSYGSELYYHMPIPTGFGMSSLDYLGFLRGRGFAIEAKADSKKKPTPRQELTIRKIEQSMTPVFVIYDTPTLTKFNDWCQSVVHGPNFTS